jgi:hypothetical protein
VSPADDLLEAETELSGWRLSLDCEESEDKCWQAHRTMEKREARGDISPKRRRFFTCQPHVIYGFHLRDHVWRKLLVDRVVEVFPGWGAWQELILGDSERKFLQRLLDLDETASPGQRFLSVPTRDSPRVVMAVRGPAANEAIDAISVLAKRPLYRVRISTENEAGSAERVFRQAAALAKRWGCIVLIEDVIGAYYPRSQPRKILNATVVPLLWFLDAFKGVVIFALPDLDVELDQRVENRLSANLQFEYNDAIPAYRRWLWKRCIRDCSPYLYNKPEDMGPVAEGYLDRLAEFELPSDTIRSIVDAATGETTRRLPDWDRVPNWDLLMELAAKRAGDMAKSLPTTTPRPRDAGAAAAALSRHDLLRELQGRIGPKDSHTSLPVSRPTRDVIGGTQ